MGGWVGESLTEGRRQDPPSTPSHPGAGSRGGRGVGEGGCGEEWW